MHDRLVALTAAPFEVALALALMAGATLGLMFYGGLWWTVRRAATFRWPGPTILASLLLRMAVALTGFLLVAHGDWARLALCVTGFLIARVVVTGLTRPPAIAQDRVDLAIEARHAP